MICSWNILMVFVIFIDLVYLLHLPSFQECPAGTFPCNSSKHCVEQQRQCDGNGDCEDNSDEWDCVDHHHLLFWNNLFRKQPGADLDEEKGFVVCGNPTLCHCTKTVILCENLNLKEIPNGLQSEAEFVSFSGNQFGQLTTSLMALVPKCFELVFMHCALIYIESGALDHQAAHLESLHLENNLLQELPNYIFSKKAKLKKLFLKANALKEISNHAFSNLDQLIELDLSYNTLNNLSERIFLPLGNLINLDLSGNNLNILSSNLFPTSLGYLKTLSLTGNHLKIIQLGAFSSLYSLNDLYLNWNFIEQLDNFTFGNLTNLQSLFLKENRLCRIALKAFSSLKNLETLDLESNPFKSIDPRVFQQTPKLASVRFTEFHQCSAALAVRICNPRSDGISSIEHLLDNVILRTSVWLMATIACIGNTIVLFGPFSTREPTAHHHAIFIKNLAFSDLLMGIYLVIIAIIDTMYRDSYLQHDLEWRHSRLCNYAGVLSTSGAEASVLILDVITWERFVSVSAPLSRRTATQKAAFLRCILVWIMAVCIAGIPLSPISYFGTEFYAGNGLCLPLHIHDPFVEGWEYSAFMFIAINAASLAFIFWAYVRMFGTIRSSAVAVRSTQRRDDRALAQRFAIIVATDCLCWLPVILVKLLALFGVSIDKVLYAWLAVLILPINSALNPILYTLTTKLFRQRMARFVFRWKSTNRYRLRRHYDNHDRERHGQIGHPPQEGGAIDGEETTNGDGNQILILVRGSTYRRNWVSSGSTPLQSYGSWRSASRTIQGTPL